MDVCTSKTAVQLLSWYDQHKRILPWRENHDAYRVWVSEIMLQQTRVEAVISYYERFLQRFPDVFALAEAPEENVMKAWEGLGYYSRVRNMQKTAKLIAACGGNFPSSVTELKKLPGFGEYTAGAVASIAFNLPVPAVDGNVLRVLSRLNCDKSDISLPKTKKNAAELISNWIPEGRAGDFNQAIMDLGATICLPNSEPKCTECPFVNICMARAQNCQMSLPVKAAKPERKREQKTVFVIVCGNQTAVRRRLSGSVLADMWELPTVNRWLTESQQAEQLAIWGIPSSATIETLTDAKHIFTHIEWNMHGVLVRTDEVALQSCELHWITPEERQNDIAIPSAFGAYLRYLPKA